MGSYERRPEPKEYNAFYQPYVSRVPAGDLVALLRDQIAGTAGLLRSAPAGAADGAYAPGKWTVKEVVGHLSDAERVLAYRALRIARADETPLASFDEDAYVPAGRFGERSLEDLVSEFEAVRAATAALFAGLPADAWDRWGTASGHGITVRALACIIAGHELHHRAILQDRYLLRPAGA